MNDITKEIDILEIFSSLNNHEVFTPPIIAKQMIDLLPEEVFKNPQSKFLDPAVKTGVFLRELAFKLHEDLADYSNNGDTEIIGFDGCYYDMNNPKERMNHILKNMLFGIATSEVTAYLSRRTLYGVMEANSNKEEGVLELLIDVEKEKSHDAITAALGNVILNEYYDHDLFNDPNYEWHESEGNIFYPNNEVSDLIKNISEENNISEIEESYFPFVDERTEHRKINEIKIGKRKNFKTGETEDMKFDVIIGNPPYQKSDGSGGNGSSAVPIYNKFVENAIKINPRYISMIIPSRWLTGGKGLDKFRENLLRDNRICKIIDFKDSNKCFPNVNIVGGVNYFLWDRHYKGLCEYNGIKRKLNEYEIFIRSNNGVSILKKIQTKNSIFMNTQVSRREPFLAEKNIVLSKLKQKNFIKIYANKLNLNKNLGLNNGFAYIDKNLIDRRIEYVEKHKVFISKAYGGLEQVLGIPFYGEPSSICSITYLLMGGYESKTEALNLIKYIKTKFFRFLVSLRKETQNSSQETFSFVPILPMDQEWTDEKLYKRYNLTKEEIDYIEEKISPME